MKEELKLAEAGWGSGFRLPISNAENLLLEKELEKRQGLIHEKKAALEDADNHIAILEKAMKNAKSHIFHDGKLAMAKKAEVKAEAEIYKLGEREIQRRVTEYKLLQKKFKKSKLQNRLLIDELDTRKRELTELADLIEYDRQALASFERKASDDDQIMSAIEEICDQDAETLRQYDLRYRKAASDTCALRRQLEETVGMTRFMQSELDGLIDRFRKLHKERSDIVSLWKTTLSSLSLRDDDMKFMAEEYEDNKNTLAELMKKLEEKETRLDQLTRTTNIASTELGRWDRKVIEIRNRLKQEGEDKEELKTGVMAHETAITVASSEIQDCRRKSAEMTAEIQELHARIQELHGTMDYLKQKLDECSGNAGYVTDKWLQLKSIAEEEQKRLSKLEIQLQKEVYLKSQWIVKVDQLNLKVDEVDHEVRGVQFMLRNIKARMEETRKDMEQRNALIYKIELHHLSLKSQIKPFDDPHYMQGGLQYRDKQDKILELTLRLEKIHKEKNRVASDVLAVFDMKRRIFQERHAASEELDASQEKSNVTRSTIQYITKLLGQFEGEISRTTVNYNLEKVKLHQLAKMFHQKRHQLYDVASYRNLLKSAMKEKRAEIEAHCRLLELKKRALADANSRCKMEIVLCAQTCKTRRQKYDNYLKLMSRHEEAGTGATDKNEAYFIIKMAQERELLQFEGDSWDRKVKEAEKETAALQNSLSLIQCSNELFRESLKPVSNDVHAEELESLKQQERELILRKSKAVKALARIRAEYTEKHGVIEMSDHQKSTMENKMVDKQYDMKQIQSDLRNQEQSLRRARLLTNRILHEISFSSAQEKEIVSLDIRLKATRKKFEFSIQALARLLNIYPAIYDSLGLLMSKEFGEQVATKFLKRVSPMVGDSSPTQSHRSRPSTGGSSAKDKAKGKSLLHPPKRVQLKSKVQTHQPSIMVSESAGPPHQNIPSQQQERGGERSIAVPDDRKSERILRRRTSMAPFIPEETEPTAERTSASERRTSDDDLRIVEDYDELLPKRTASDEAVLHMVQEAVEETVKHHDHTLDLGGHKEDEKRLESRTLLAAKASTSSSRTTVNSLLTSTSSMGKIGGIKGQGSASAEKSDEHPQEKAEGSSVVVASGSSASVSASGMGRKPSAKKEDEKPRTDDT